MPDPGGVRVPEEGRGVLIEVRSTPPTPMSTQSGTDGTLPGINLRGTHALVRVSTRPREGPHWDRGSRGKFRQELIGRTVGFSTLLNVTPEEEGHTLGPRIRGGGAGGAPRGEELVSPSSKRDTSIQGRVGTWAPSTTTLGSTRAGGPVSRPGSRDECRRRGTSPWWCHLPRPKP